MENQSDEAQATPWDFGDVSAELELIENATDRAPNNITTLLIQLERSGVLAQNNINQINQYLSNNQNNIDNRIKFNTLLSIIYEDLYGYYIQIIEDVEWERPVTSIQL
ncbi:uncharacterized protein LOC123293220 [Chrysoperla carnea]|uniref:uncharacterized protein LOC123293220 n=1 Tax=Chrysoperla carnea TaxID=189513 RepID=UPI001D089819|nr:uncharacterized protein LOC123293220 [Chrysoperla carnea]